MCFYPPPPKVAEETRPAGVAAKVNVTGVIVSFSADVFPAELGSVEIVVETVSSVGYWGSSMKKRCYWGSFMCVWGYCTQPFIGSTIYWLNQLLTQSGWYHWGTQGCSGLRHHSLQRRLDRPTWWGHYGDLIGQLGWGMLCEQVLFFVLSKKCLNLTQNTKRYGWSDFNDSAGNGLSLDFSVAPQSPYEICVAPDDTIPME